MLLRVDTDELDTVDGTSGHTARRLVGERITWVLLVGREAIASNTSKCVKFTPPPPRPAKDRQHVIMAILPQTQLK